MKAACSSDSQVQLLRLARRWSRSMMTDVWGAWTPSWDTLMGPSSTWMRSPTVWILRPWSDGRSASVRGENARIARIARTGNGFENNDHHKEAIGIRTTGNAPNAGTRISDSEPSAIVAVLRGMTDPAEGIGVHSMTVETQANPETHVNPRSKVGSRAIGNALSVRI